MVDGELCFRSAATKQDVGRAAAGSLARRSCDPMLDSGAINSAPPGVRPPLPPRRPKINLPPTHDDGAEILFSVNS